jgi:hypothetical protein
MNASQKTAKYNTKLVFGVEDKRSDQTILPKKTNIIG